MPKEIWRPIMEPAFKGRYQVSNLGRVRRIKVLTAHKFAGSGRLYVSLSMPHKAKYRHGRALKNKSVHRLVAGAFCENPDQKKQVNHKNGDKFDNCASNLEWVTNRENMDHAMKTGLIGPASNRKVDPTIAIEMHRAGQSQRDIAKFFNCTKNAVATTLSHHLRGVPWKPSGMKKRKKKHYQPVR